MKSLLVIFAIAYLMGWAGSQGGGSFAGVPVFALCAALAFAIQWAAFVPAFQRQTERYYDLTGSFTYISTVLLALLLTTPVTTRALLLALFIIIWAARLGSFLFQRISQDGSDSRFDKIKPSAIRFFTTWNLQGLWVLMTAACALAAMTSGRTVPFSLWDGLGVLLWVSGFAIEVIADAQKRRFRREHGRERFMNTGLWSRSRHPNYLGEIMLWVGIAILAAPALAGWQYLTLLSPIFVSVLLTRISGIPLLERKADKTWGDDADYQAYKAATPVLIPGLRRAPGGR